MAIGSNSLHSSWLHRSEEGQGSPMDSVANLMDVMLVFACGLIVALVARYNVDLSASEVDQSNMHQVNSELTQVEQGVSDGVTNYAEVGTVYRDLDTGELYVVEGSNAE